LFLQAAAPRVADQLERVIFSNAFVVTDGQSQLDNIPAEPAGYCEALLESCA
jgi:hypothetical protein